MKNRVVFLVGVFLILILIGTGCIPKYSINTESMGSPVSMTNKQVVKDYVVVKHFKLHISQYCLLGALPLSSYDLSNKLTELIHENNGDGIINIRFNNNPSIGDLFINLISLTWLTPNPINIEGDIIRYTKNKGGSL